jgi:peptidoglycan/xylan/chitin deacetylase (PgdA/CDA1 family)
MSWRGARKCLGCVRGRGGVRLAALCLVVLAACGPAVPAAIVAPPVPLITVPAPTAAASEVPTLAPSASPTPTDVPAALPTATVPPTASPTMTPAPTATAMLLPTATPLPWPTPDALAGQRAVRLPILMYHYVEPWPADADDVRKGLTVQPDDFSRQMAYLHDHGYVTVSLYDLVYALALGWPLPEHAVVLTFDDGYRSLFDYAVPTMQGYGYTGTVFVITQLMDEGFPQFLTWPQAEALYALGWKIEPHTKTHETLAGRDRDFQLYQMLGSVQTVEAHIGTRPRFFNYPSGRYDELTLQLAREINLWGGVTVGVGRVHSLATVYTLSRVRVSGTGTMADFVSGVENP